MIALHVQPRADRWVVLGEGMPDPLSEHAEAGAATRAAREHAVTVGAVQVLLHDRYNRIRSLACDPRRRASPRS